MSMTAPNTTTRASNRAILVDVSRCTGCETCVAACIDANGLDAVKADHDRATTPDGLSEHRLCSILEVAPNRYARKSCMHCDEPSCVAACLVGGITKSAEGPVVYDADKCIGCRYCMLACPYHVPRYEWSQTIPFMKKCDMCYERVGTGGKPACVGACPHDALLFGERDELIVEARRRIASGDGLYLDRIFGQEEWGGGSVLYISDTDLAAIGFGDHTETIPSITDPLIHRTPQIGIGVAASITTLSWVIGRRQKLMNQTAEPAARDNSGADDA